MPYQLVVIKGRSASQALRIPADGVTTVGRQQGCQLRIASSQVSRQHCEFFEKNGHLLVKDLGSSNGTYVNGTKLQGEQRVVEPGAVLLIGGVSFRVEQAEAGAAVAPAAPAASGAAPARKPSDTAVAEAVAAGDDNEEIELDFEVSADEDLSPAAALETEVAAAKSEPDAAPAMSDDAVAEYLLNIDVDDDDKV